MGCLRKAEWLTDRVHKINVVFVSTGLSVGGAENMLGRLIACMDGASFNPAVVSLCDKGAIGLRLEARGVRVIALNMRRGRVPWLGLCRLTSALRLLRPDILQGWMYHGNLAASLAAGFLANRPPVIWAIRQSLYDTQLEHPLTRAVIWASARLSEQPRAILYNSEVSRRQHERLGFQAERGRVIPNGVDIPPRLASKPFDIRTKLRIPSSSKVIGHIARYHPMKDHATFLHAARLIHGQCPDTVFVLLGSGVDSENRPLVSRIRALGISDCVHLVGEQLNAQEWIAGMDVVCSTSAWGEGFPNVLAEAMAVGIPCVTTAVGDSEQLIGDTGVIVGPGDAAAVARAIVRLLSMSAEGRARLGDAARRRIAERYAINDVVGRYEALYQEAAHDVRYRRAL